MHSSHTRRTILGVGFSLPLWTSEILRAAAPVVRAPAPQENDSTAILQKTVDALPAGAVLDGVGRDYVVTRLVLKSNMILRNFRLRAKGTARPLDAVLTIDGNVSPALNISITDVHIDGNRAAQTNLHSEEDGGRDGIRIVGKAERLMISGCSANNCATDGLKIFSHQSLSRDDAKLNFRDIFVSNCRFLNNRRHGASADSLENVYFIECEFSGNGVDVPGSQNEGARGAIDNNMLYAAGVDIEGYGVGSGVNGLYFLRCQALRNARFGFQFWEPTPPSTPGFLPRRNILFENCTMDGGVSPKHGRQALELSQPPAIRGGQPTYQDVRLIGLKCTGTVILNGVHNATFAGGVIRSPYPGFWGIAEHCRNLHFVDVDSESKIFAIKK